MSDVFPVAYYPRYCILCRQHSFCCHSLSRNRLAPYAVTFKLTAQTYSDSCWEQKHVRRESLPPSSATGRSMFLPACSAADYFRQDFHTTLHSSTNLSLLPPAAHLSAQRECTVAVSIPLQATARHTLAVTRVGLAVLKSMLGLTCFPDAMTG